MTQMDNILLLSVTVYVLCLSMGSDSSLEKQNLCVVACVQSYIIWGSQFHLSEYFQIL